MVAISIKNVSKKFKLHVDKPSTLKERILRVNDTSYEEFWALSGVSLDIEKGSTVGLIGQNGSGKSTLLKLISKIMYPTSGSIEVNGRVSSLIELGAGFHSDFTGRENIYTNAAIFGMSKKEIDKRLDEIIDFSELGSFIDNPVRTYSSGMYMRLAFSVAINVAPEILLIDEILGVGDANFQKKCFNKISEFKNQGVTIVIVAHDLTSIEKICGQAIWMNTGKVMKIGTTKEITIEYLEFMGEAQAEKLSVINKNISQKAEQEENKIEESEEEIKATEADITTISEVYEKKRWGSKEIEIYNVEMVDKDGVVQSSFRVGAYVEIRLYYRVHKKVKDVVFGVGLYAENGLLCIGTNTEISRYKITFDQLKNEGIFIMKIKEMNLLEGTFWLDVACEAEGGYPYDYITKRYYFNTISELNEIGICRLDYEWEMI